MIRSIRSYEEDAIRLFELSNDVVYIQERPPEVRYIAACGREAKYMPDFEITLRNFASVIVEVKPLRFLQDQENRERFPIIRRLLQERGQRFLTLSEDVIKREPLMTNVKMVMKYRRPFEARKDWTEALEAVRRMLPARFCRIAGRIGGAAAHVLLGLQFLQFDYSATLFDPEHTVVDTQLEVNDVLYVIK